jgi:nucleoid-associated protein
MAVEECIVHQINRSQMDAGAKVNCRDESLELSDSVLLMLNEARHLFNTKTAKCYGQFDPDQQDNPAPGWLQDYDKGNLSLASLSQKMVEHFRLLLEQTESICSGHLLFWKEDTVDASWFYMALFQQQTGLVVTSHLEVEQTEYVDLSRLGFGCRINLDQWRDKLSEKYLTLSKIRGDQPLLDVLKQWVSFTDTVNVSEDTSEFLNIVDAYAENLPEEEAPAYREKVIQYCMDQDKEGEPVVYKELSYYLDEHQPQHFEQFVEEQQEKPKPELIPDRAQLRKYVRFSGRSKEVSIQFAATLLGEQVEYDADKERLVFKQLPKPLLSQLKKHRAN